MILCETKPWPLNCFYRSRHPEMFCKKGVLRNSTKFTGKHLRQGLFLNKVAGLTQVFSFEFCEISKNTFSTEHPRTTATGISYLYSQKKKMKHEWLNLVLRKQPPEVFCKKRFLEISQNSLENICGRASILIKLTLLKQRLWHRYFPVNLEYLFLQNTSGSCF